MAFFVVMNKQKWASLPKEVQTAIQKVNEEWIEKTAKAWDEIDKAGLELAKSKGIQLHPLVQAGRRTLGSGGPSHVC